MGKTGIVGFQSLRRTTFGEKIPRRLLERLNNAKTVLEMPRLKYLTAS